MMKSFNEEIDDFFLLNESDDKNDKIKAEKIAMVSILMVLIVGFFLLILIVII